MISRQNFQNVSNFTENSRAPQTLFQGAALMQTNKFLNNEYLLH